jgi:hypothetical protein
MATDIEKQSLEAHVELCAERYNNLDRRLYSLDERMGRMENLIMEVKAAIAETPGKASNLMLGVGTTIMGALIGGLITVIVRNGG